MKSHTKKPASGSNRTTCGILGILGIGALLLLGICGVIGSMLNPQGASLPTTISVATRLVIPTEESVGIATDIAASLQATATSDNIPLAALPTRPPTKPALVKPTTTDVPPTPMPEPIAVANTNLIVRSGPGTAYKQVTTLKEGESVELVAISSDKAWLKHKKGWSNAAYLTTQYELGKLPVELVAAPPTRVPTKRPATAIPPTAFVQAPPPSNCNPNYTPCVPNASDVDCAGGSGNGPAYVVGPVRVIGSDVYDLDRDGDGIGCD